MNRDTDAAVISNLRQIVVARQPLIDLRAPQEFAKGAVPGARNLPLLNDEERRAVGTCYKHDGQAAAVALGHKLVCGSTRQSRIDEWLEYARQHPTTALYCWRGGLRSEVAQQWLAENGCQVPRIDGGFKAVRSFLLASIDRLADNSQLLLVGGRTGVGKTDLLMDLPNAIDLEGLARHRGSAFGNRSLPQPTQVDFENSLAASWISREDSGFRAFVMEDEGKFIGRCRLPPRLIAAFGEADLLILEDSFPDRVARINRDYVAGLLAEIEAQADENPFALFRDSLLGSLARIRKRLGMVRYAEVKALMISALDEHQAQSREKAHDKWIAQLLRQYYDPMYDYQIKLRKNRIIATGNAETIRKSLGKFQSPQPKTRSA